MKAARKFDRFNQPVRCRMCSKLTTFSEVNGYVGLDLCGPCFDAAGAENEVLDRYVPDPPPIDPPPPETDWAGRELPSGE
jgi:hypothetical protein